MFRSDLEYKCTIKYIITILNGQEWMGVDIKKGGNAYRKKAMKYGRRSCYSQTDKHCIKQYVRIPTGISEYRNTAVLFFKMQYGFLSSGKLLQIPHH